MILHLSNLNHDSEVYHDIWKKYASANFMLDDMMNGLSEVIIWIESPIYDSLFLNLESWVAVVSVSVAGVDIAFAVVAAENCSGTMSGTIK